MKGHNAPFLFLESFKMDLITLLRYQTKEVFSGTLTDETTTVQIQSKGNAILCSALMYSGTGQVEINYYQRTSNKTLERTPIASRTIIAPDNEAKQDILTSVHDKVFCEMVVTGSISLTVMAKAVDEIAIETSSSGNAIHQILEGEAVGPADKGTLAAAVDTDGNAKFLRIEGDDLKVSSDTSAKIEGKITVISINEFGWTAIPATPLTGRRALNIQNPSGSTIYINYDNTAPANQGIKVASDGERSYDAKDSIQYYARASTGAGAVNITVEEIS